MRHELLKKLKVAFAIGLVVIAGVFTYLITPLFGNKVLIVRSGSMTPTLPVGSLVAIRPKEAVSSPLPAYPHYSVGDIISFKDSQNPKTVITHRVASVKIENNQIFYQTKGDANNDLDQNLVSEKNVLGSTFLTVPFLGKLFSFTKTKTGFLLLVLIPALMVILFESYNIFKELRKKKPLQYSYIKNFKPHQGPTFSALVPLLAVGLVFAQTAAYFSDTASSSANVFAASPNFPTNHLVINEVMPNPPNTNACGSENDAEWVEIYNPTSNTVNLDSWSVGDGNSMDDLPNVNLPAGGFAVVSDCAESSFTTIWTLPSGVVYIDLTSAVGNSLNNGGEEIRLQNGSTLVDSMSFGSNTTSFSPSVSAPSSGHSIERNPDGNDTNTASDWVDRTTPTPGS